MDAKIRSTTKALIEKYKKAGFIQQIAGVNGRLQYVVLAALEEMAREQGYRMSATPTLADTILTQHKHKVDLYGGKTYPLSESQIKVVVSEYFDWATGERAKFVDELMRE